MELSFKDKIKPVGSSTNQVSPTSNLSFASKIKPVAPAEPGIGSTLLGMAKGIVSAPATMVARPIQLGAELLGASAEDVNKFTDKYTAGIVAPVPQNFSDVKKDVGRGIETVALGVPGAPIASGTAFGVGSSLEQGNDLFSVQTALNAAVGAAGGKVLDTIGKPIMDMTGNVVGTVTPVYLKNLASQGAKAVEDFMSKYEIAGGKLKPVTEKITKGAEAVDTGIKNLFKGGKGTVGEAITSQYPGLSKDSMTKHFEKIEKENIIKPALDPKNKKAAEIYTDSKKRGIDLGTVATDNKVRVQDLQKDGIFDTAESVAALRKEAMTDSHDILRPALQEAEMGVERVPVSDLRNRMIGNVKKISKTEITDSQREKLIKDISNEFADDSAAARAHPDGYSLTDLHDSTIGTSNNVKYSYGQNVDDSLSNTYYKTQSNTFRKLLEDKAPAELDIKTFKSRIQDRFKLADYLESINGKKVPRSLFQKTLKKSAQIAGMTAGGSIGNVFGAFGGYNAGGMIIDAFSNASNPIKAAYLKSVAVKQPEIFQAFKDYFGEQQVARWMRKALPAPSAIPMGGVKEPVQRLFTGNPVQDAVRLDNIRQLPAPRSSGIPMPGKVENINRPYTASDINEADFTRKKLFKEK